MGILSIDRFNDFHPQQLWCANRFRVEELSHDVGGLEPDRLLLSLGKPLPAGRIPASYLMYGTEDLFHTDPHAALGLITKAFSLQGSHAWKYQYRTYLDLFRQFFRQASDCPAWVSIIPDRKHFLSRVTAKTMPKECIREPSYYDALHKLRSDQLDLGFSTGKIPLKKLLLAYRPDGVERESKVIQVQRLRRIKQERYYHSTDKVVCLATKGIDDATVLSHGGLPVCTAVYNSIHGTSDTPSAILARMYPQEPYPVTQLALTFMPSSDGRTAALASGRRDLAMFMELYGNEAILLSQVTNPCRHAK